MNFDAIAISETRITKNKAQINHIALTNYSCEHCPTESSAGGTLLYIRNHLSYKTRNDLNIYKSADLESTFLQHPVMDFNEFMMIIILMNYYTSFPQKTNPIPF